MYGARLRVVADAELQKEQLFVGLPVSLIVFCCQWIFMRVLLARKADS